MDSSERGMNPVAMTIIDTRKKVLAKPGIEPATPVSKSCALLTELWHGKSLPFPKRPILDSSKEKETADDNFKFNENGIKFSKQVENTVGKEKLLVTSDFSFSHIVFKRLVLQTRKNQGLFGKG